MARRQRRQRGRLEEDVLACLAAATEPMSPSDVQAALHDQLAYTTVMTTLSRLHEKGAVGREQRGRADAYFLTDTPDAARASMTAFTMRRLLDAQDDRAGVLAQFVGNLEAADEQLLKDLLRRSRRPR